MMKWFGLILIISLVYAQNYGQTDDFEDDYDDTFDNDEDDVLNLDEQINELIDSNIANGNIEVEAVDEANEYEYKEFEEDDSVFDSERNKFVSKASL